MAVVAAAGRIPSAATKPSPAAALFSKECGPARDSPTSASTKEVAVASRPSRTGAGTAIRTSTRSTLSKSSGGGMAAGSAGDGGAALPVSVIPAPSGGPVARARARVTSTRSSRTVRRLARMIQS